MNNPKISWKTKFIKSLRFFASYLTIQKAYSWLEQFLMPLLFVFIILLFFHSRTRFQGDTDEGVNLIKALLVKKGYSLYSEVWSDQPPLFTYILALITQLFGYKVDLARNIVLLLSASLLWSAFGILKISWKSTYAFSGCFLIFLLPKYITLSVSVMIGLPSIAFAMISLFFLILWHKKRTYYGLLLSAFFLSMAVLTKLMIGFIAPVFLIGLLTAEYFRFRLMRKWREFLVPIGSWLTAFIVPVFLTLLIVVKPENIFQLLGDHIEATEMLGYSSPQFTINYHFQEAWPFLLLAILGLIFIVRAHKWELLYLAGWMLVAYIFLYFHKPVWYHHQLYVTIPGAILGGIAVVEGIELCFYVVRKKHLPNIKLQWIRGLSLLGIFFLIITTVRAPERFNMLSAPPSLKTSGLGIGGKREKIFLSIYENSDKTRWIVTDLPMYAYRTGISVPPELAVFTEKRIVTGHITERQILDVLVKYQPEQILFGRFTFPGLDEYLNIHYRITLENDKLTLYVRRDLLPNDG